MFHIPSHVIGDNQVNRHVIVWESRVISIDDENLRKFAIFLIFPRIKISRFFYWTWNFIWSKSSWILSCPFLSISKVNLRIGISKLPYLNIVNLYHINYIMYIISCNSLSCSAHTKTVLFRKLHLNELK